MNDDLKANGLPAGAGCPCGGAAVSTTSVRAVSRDVLTYATVCSGIECMSVACIGLPLRPVFFSEIEPFPCAVLKAHYPDVPNLGDMSKIQVSENGLEITNGTTTIRLHERLGILAGGTPCQDVSVAGKRAGMQEGSGTRSSLAFDFVRLARELRPRWVLWENVAGSIDSKNAPDFLRFASALGDCGYSLAWRVLDAQYVRVDGMERAVPQRRRRVWCVGRLRTVGCAGADESAPAQILFEPDCVAGHTPPRRRAGQGFAYSLEGRDRVDAGVVGDATERGDGGCLNPNDSLSKRIFDEHSAFHSVCAGSGGGQLADGVCIALDGDKLKPREDQRKGGNGFGINEEGAGYTLTGVDRHGVAYGIGNEQAAEAASTMKECSQTLNCMHDKQATVQCYENHAQDSRVQGQIDTAPTQGSSNANSASVSGNNPLVCFSKVSHPTAPNGEGERWDEREVAQTRNTFDNGEKRCQEVVVSTAYKLDSTASNSMKSANPHSGFHETQVAACLDTTTPDPSKGQGGNVIISTNSNGEDVAATLTRDLAKQTGAQQQNGGGYVVSRRAKEGAECE